jgi:hypothetical protein
MCFALGNTQIYSLFLRYVWENIDTIMLGPYSFPLQDSFPEIPHHLLEKSHLAPKNDKNPPYVIVTREQELVEQPTDLITTYLP